MELVEVNNEELHQLKVGAFVGCYACPIVWRSLVSTIKIIHLKNII